MHIESYNYQIDINIYLHNRTHLISLDLYHSTSLMCFLEYCCQFGANSEPACTVSQRYTIKINLLAGLYHCYYLDLVVFSLLMSPDLLVFNLHTHQR